MIRKLSAEFFGTAFLVMIVLGSGIMGQTLFAGHVGLALLANSIATGAGLFVLIQSLGHISGCHINPVVSFVEVLWGRLRKKDAVFYVLAQLSGAYLGVIATHLMFKISPFVVSSVNRSGPHLWISEGIATFGLICVIGLSGKKHVEFAPLSIAAYIMSAYWFTSSTAFTNPAMTFARMFTETFGGMSPDHYLSFVASQFIGATLGWVAVKAISE